MLFLGVCKALRGMHHYRVRAGAQENAKRKAGRVRQDAEAEDADAARKARRAAGGGAENGEAAEPLMPGEIVRSQEGVEEGELRAYAHRDIKPGMCQYMPPTAVPAFPPNY